jgi:hypothetical protein
LEKIKASMAAEEWGQFLMMHLPPHPEAHKMAREEEAEDDRLSDKRFAERPLNKARIY